MHFGPEDDAGVSSLYQKPVATMPAVASAVRQKIEEYGNAVAAHERDGKFEHAAQFRLDLLMKELGPLLATATAESLPMDTAPTDGTIVRLLVDYSGEDACNPLEDAEPETPRWTIGANMDSNHPDEPEGWLMAGWNWEQDCFWQGHGKPIGWLPFTATTSSAALTEPRSLWANIRAINSALTGELGVQTKPYLYVEKVAIDDIEFLYRASVGEMRDAARYRFLREIMMFNQPADGRCEMELSAALPALDHDIHKDFLAERFDRSVDRTVDAAIATSNASGIAS